MFLRILCLLLPLLLATRTNGAPESLQEDMLFRNWTTREGLPQDHVRVLTGTRDGFLWIGTDAGLARFDGVEFKTYGLHEGLGAITILSLYEARDGGLWVGTLGGGVSVLRGGKIIRTYGREDGLPSLSVSTISEDTSGAILAASLSGFSRLENDRFVPFAGPGNLTPRTLFRDKAGTVWAAASNLSLWRWREDKWNPAEVLGPTTANAFCEDNQGRLWIGDAEQRLWCKEGEKWKVHTIPALRTANISNITTTPDGTLWISSYRASLIGLRNGQIILPTTQSDPFLQLSEAAFATADGQLWVGTSTRGLYSLTPRRVTVARVDQEENPGANFIGALMETAPGQFMIGTQGRGYFLWNDGKVDPLEDGQTVSRGSFGNAILRTRDGRVLAGGTRGLFQFDKGGIVTVKITPAIRDIWDLCEDGKGGLWIGHGSGTLQHVVGTKATTVPYRGRGDPIKGLAQEADGTLWVGTRGNGLFRVKGKDSKRFGLAEGLLTEVIRVLYLDKTGALWVGTAGGGLAVRSGEKFLSVTTREGLPDDVVSQITEDDRGRLWLGTNRGLAVFSAEETAQLRTGTAREFHPLLITRADGLRSEEFTITQPVHTASGQLAFATNDGFAILKPDDFQEDPRTPPVFIEQVLANGQPVEPVDGKLSLPPGIERLELHFTGLHFGAPERLSFRNRLTGLEEDWGSASPERRVEYRNLKPGSYRFELSATIGNGLWSPQPAALEIELAPHFWETNWFRLLVILTALGLVGLAVRWRERLRARRKIEALQREQAVQTERARIARDLHDDVGASLTQVALLSELAQGDLDAHPERASGHINEIFTTAKEVTRALDEIVWAVNPAHDTLESFATFLGAFVQNYARSTGLTPRLDIPASLPAIALASSVRHHLYLATKEVLHNVVKHAQATEVHLSLVVEASSFRLLLADNGRGLNDPGEPATPGADGLLNLRERLEQIGGSCSYLSHAGKGTQVEMIVPLRVNY